MTFKKKQRLYYLTLMFIGLGLGLTAVLYTLRQELVFFYTPEDLAKNKKRPDDKIRLGGVVKKNTLKLSTEGLKGEFILTDFKREILINFDGALPDLLREEQGVVVEGFLQAENIFKATKVLAKHDENYRPPLEGQKPWPVNKTLKES